MPTTTVTPANSPNLLKGAQVARLKVIVSADLPAHLANQAIVSQSTAISSRTHPCQTCEVVFNSEGRTIKADEPLSMALMVDEDYAPYISAVMETCHISVIPVQNVARL